MLRVKTVEHNSRLRKYYHITKEGMDKIEEFKEYWADIKALAKLIIGEEAI